MARVFWGAVLLALLPGCAVFVSPDVEPREPPRSQLDVPFFPDTTLYCGPAALAAVLNFRGRDVSVERLTEQVYLPGRAGSLTVEVRAAPRRHGLLSYPLDGGFDALLAELAAGNPVVVLQNLAFNWWPRWHYAVAVGYELERRELLLHSGEHEYYRESFRRFDNTWRRGDRWAIVVVEPERIPASARVLPFLRAAADLEEVGQGEAARKAFMAAAERWPDSRAAQFAAGNSLLEERPARARDFYLRALQVDRHFIEAWNNLAFALQRQGCHDAAMVAVERARLLAPDDERVERSARKIRERADETGPADTCPGQEALKL